MELPVIAQIVCDSCHKNSFTSIRHLDSEGYEWRFCSAGCKLRHVFVRSVG